MEAFFWHNFFGNEKDYADKEEWQEVKQQRDELNKKLPETVGYGYESKFAPELAKDKITSFYIESSQPADFVSVLTGQNSLLYISQDVKTELKEYAEQQTQKARKQK